MMTNDELRDLIARYQAYDMAQMLAQLEEEQQDTFVSMLPVSLSAEVLEYMEPELQYQILNRLNDSIRSQIFNEMSSDIVVDLLLSVHPYQAKKLLGYLSEEYREKINTLMNFSPNTAGRIATVDYISARKSWTVDQTLAHVRKVGREAEIVSYIYVVDKHGELLGVVSLKEVILANPGTFLEEMIQGDTVSVPADMHQQEAANILSKYDFVAIPVVAANNRLIGIITVDDLIDVIHEEMTEDFQKLGASQPLEEPYMKNSVWRLFRKRIGWLLILFIAGAYTSSVLQYYEDTLSEFVALTFFIPLLIGTGGNSGTQTVTTLVRALALGEVRFKDVLVVASKEVAAGALIGTSMGIVAFMRAQLLDVGFDVGVVVAVTALFIVLWASMVSAVLPLVIHKLKLDPAVVSGPLIATLVDGTGLIIYLTLARVMLNL